MPPSVSTPAMIPSCSFFMASPRWLVSDRLCVGVEPDVDRVVASLDEHRSAAVLPGLEYGVVRALDPVGPAVRARRRVELDHLLVAVPQVPRLVVGQVDDEADVARLVLEVADLELDLRRLLRDRGARDG